MNTTASLMRSLLAAFGDADAIVELLTEDAEWWITPTVGVLGSPSRGRESIGSSMQTIFRDLYADAEAEVHMVLADGERASARFTLRARAQFFGGKPYENEYCIWIERSGDKIAKVWEYLDVAHVTGQFAGED